MVEPLTLPRAMVDGMIRHARAFVPQECCGLIAGQDGRAIKRYELRNVDPSVLRYQADPQDQLAAMREMWDRDWELLAIYHSHTHSPAYPSATDVRLAFYPDSYYVIVSLQEADVPRVRAFRIVDGAITEHPLLVDG
ncbi:MAG TPA: M67 family metallopeptidase [Chloroflexota bacterium]|nr:M67 family metallopeptidase [Chloroflexota bacterium]